MDTAAIFTLIAEMVQVLPSVVDAGISIEQRVEKIIAVAKGGASGTLTPEEITQARADLDADMDDFNTELPPE